MTYKFIHSFRWHVVGTFLAGLLLLSGANCSGQPFSSLAPSLTVVPTLTATPQTTPEVTPTRGPINLRLWLPAEFDPAGDGPAAHLLKERLEEFTRQHPGVRIEVRLKSTEGPGGLLDALTNTRAAAPLALPDLVALPRPTLEAAALKGLIQPYDEYLPATPDQDWYPYAAQLGRLQGSTFGLPFAGDALLQVYRTTAVDVPPASLAEALQLTGPLAFPAADPQALFTLALYQAAGGLLRDEQDRPTIKVDSLTEVLNFYQQGANSQLLPFWLTQFSTDEQAWQAFEDQQAALDITWASRYLQSMPADVAAAPLPTKDGTPFTLATGWVWALASANPEHQALSVDLAEFLTQSPFLAEWTAAAGYLPPRPSALQAWQSSSLHPLVAGLSETAKIIPPSDVLTSLAPPLVNASTAVLKQQADPAAAAQEAADSLSGP